MDEFDAPPCAPMAGIAATAIRNTKAARRAPSPGGKGWGKADKIRTESFRLKGCMSTLGVFQLDRRFKK